MIKFDQKLILLKYFKSYLFFKLESCCWPYSGWGVEKALPTSFSPVTSTNVRISPQIFLTFRFNTFDRLVQNFKFVPSASPKLLNFNKDHPSKKRFFWSNPYKIEVMITSLITNARVTKLCSCGHIHNIIWLSWQNCVGDVIDKIYDVITSISKDLYFKKAWG